MAKTGRLKRQAAERAGRRAEWLAALSLRAKGYRIIESRFKCPQGEVDLIARRGDVIAFIEVKARPSHDEALFAVTPRNEHRICRAAIAWLSRHPRLATANIRYDIISVASGWPRHHRDAFRPDAYQRSVNQGDIF